MKKTIEIMVSNHHVHLQQQDVDVLFGKDYCLTKKDMLGPRTYSCEEKVIARGPRGEMEMRVLGPCRKYTQIELLRGDLFKLGLRAPLRDSGEVEDSGAITLVGPEGTLELSSGAIVARRHIHIGKAFADPYGLTDGQTVSVLVEGERSVTLNNVLVHVTNGEDNVMHIDMDEANAAGIGNHYIAEIL